MAILGYVLMFIFGPVLKITIALDLETEFFLVINYVAFLSR